MAQNPGRGPGSGGQRRSSETSLEVRLGEGIVGLSSTMRVTTTAHARRPHCEGFVPHLAFSPLIFHKNTSNSLGRPGLRIDDREMGKLQHYVPRFLLRNFSCPISDRCIDVVNLNSQKFHSRVSIRNQCAKNYIYGKQQDLEAALADLEAKTSSIVRSILEAADVPQIGSVEHERLVRFVAAQHGRTPAAAAAKLKMLTLMSDEVSRLANYQDHKLAALVAKFREETENPAAESVKEWIGLAPCIADLNDLLIDNSSDLEFVLPDTGVVFHNEWARGDHGRGVLGAACQGLQILLPLSPRCILLKYDSSVYRLSGQSYSKCGSTHRVAAKRAEVVHINRVLVANADENVYFTGDQSTKEKLADFSHQVRAPRTSQTRSQSFDEVGARNRHLVHAYQEHPDVAMHVSWMTVHPGMTKVPILERSRRLRGTAQAAFQKIRMAVQALEP